MKTIYIVLDSDGYVNGYGSNPSSNPREIEIQLFYDNEFFKCDMNVFKYVDGELIKDEKRQKQLLEEAEKENSKLSIEDQNSIAILELAESLATLGITGLSTQLGGK